MEEKDLVEFEYSDEKRHIRLKKREQGTNSSSVILNPVLRSSSESQQVSEQVQIKQEEKSTNLIEFRSPLVGTFYRSPKPGSPPFVEVGDEVSEESVICIIEAMKVMNEIKAQIKGIITEVLAKDGQAVEYGQPLFVIKKK
jgi:acetyl-CoA carboxylase biotin carboxyl carrier protein